MQLGLFCFEVAVSIYSASTLIAWALFVYIHMQVPKLVICFATGLRHDMVCTCKACVTPCSGHTYCGVDSEFRPVYFRGEADLDSKHCISPKSADKVWLWSNVDIEDSHVRVILDVPEPS